MERIYIKTDKNGTRYFSEKHICDRCGNLMGGLYCVGTMNDQLIASPVDAGVCWKCHGEGFIWETVKEYTPEHLAKLEKQRAKREAKRLAAIAAEQQRIEAEKAAAAEAARAEYNAKVERCARSSYVGNVGDRLEFDAVVTKSISYERRAFCGYGMETCHVHEFTDVDGNVFVWYSTAGISANEGDTVRVKGTVKDHKEYTPKENILFDEGGARCYDDKNLVTKQTVLTRCKIELIKEATPEEPDGDEVKNAII